MARAGDRVILHGGVYRLAETLVLGPQNSGVTWMAAPGEKPILSGGIPVTGWTVDTNGRYKATVDLDNFRQLWVNGQRVSRPRGPAPAGLRPWGGLKAIVKKDTNRPDLASTPDYIPGTVEGFSSVAGSTLDAKKSADIAIGYTTADPNVAEWRNPGDIEFGYLQSFEHKIVKVSKISRTVDGASIEMAEPGFFLSQSEHQANAPSPTYVENVFEWLGRPGEWYFDRPNHTLYYLPKPGEDMRRAEVIAPKLETLVEVRGAQDIKFEGLAFAHATWLQPSTEMGLPDLQASVSVTPYHGFFRHDRRMWHPCHIEGLMSHANIVLDNCRGVRFDGCTFTALGGSGLAIQNGSCNNIISGCRFDDISCNGIMVGGISKEDHHPSDPNHVTKGNQIINNIITHTGVEYTDSVGVFYGYTDGTVIAHNEISGLPYTGISGGWGWGITDAGGGDYRWPVVYTTPTTCRNNRIEYNRIHDIMQQHWDGGAVYLLGRQDNTHVRYNHVTDSVYPGALYFDEGSAGGEASFNVIDAGCVRQVFDYGRGFGHDNYMPPAFTPVDEPIPSEPVQFTLVAHIRLREHPPGKNIGAGPGANPGAGCDPRRWIACTAANENVDGNISLIIDGSNIAGYVNIGGGPANCHEAKGDAPVPLEIWMTVALTYDGDTLRVFCDGKKAAESKIGKTRIPGTGPLTIGSRTDRYGMFNCGDIADVRLFDRALSLAEINKAEAIAQGLVKHWNFNQAPDPTESKIISEAGPKPDR